LPPIIFRVKPGARLPSLGGSVAEATPDAPPATRRRRSVFKERVAIRFIRPFLSIVV